MRWPVVVLLLGLTACAGDPPRLAVPGIAPAEGSDVAKATRYMAQAAAWSAETLAAEIRRLSNGALTPLERLKLAWLLARKGARGEDLARAQELLAGQESTYPDPGARQMMLLVLRLVRLELDLREEHRRTTALQSKLDRIVDLERSLQERNRQQELK